MTEYLLYGIAKGDSERYQERLLSCTHTMDRIDQVKQLAIHDGFHSFRVVEFKDTKPEFSNIRLLNV